MIMISLFKNWMTLYHQEEEKMTGFPLEIISKSDMEPTREARTENMRRPRGCRPNTSEGNLRGVHDFILEVVQCSSLSLCTFQKHTQIWEHAYYPETSAHQRHT